MKEKSEKMALEPGKKYPGVVLNGGLTQLGDGEGKPALWFLVKTPEGTIEHLQWCTPAAIKQARKTLQECFGTTEENLQNQEYILHFGERIRDAEVTVTTKPDLNEKGEVESQWMNPRGAKKTPPTSATLSKVASLFGGGKPAAPVSDTTTYGPPANSWPSDKDIPF